MTIPDELPTVKMLPVVGLHAPPMMPSVSVVVLPRQTVDEPEMGVGDVLTLTVVVI